MTEYSISSALLVSPEAVGQRLYAAYANRRDEEAVMVMVSFSGGSQRGLYVTEGRMPFPDRTTSLGQRPIMFEIYPQELTAQGLATSFRIKAGTEMENPHQLGTMTDQVRHALQGD